MYWSLMMNAIETLLDRYWIIKEKDKELYYQLKHDLDNKSMQKFIREKLGWKFIHTEHFLKLEKVPAHAEPFMGIQSFTEIRDYCFLCSILMFLEDKEENSQFLLSELIRYVEVVMKDYMNVDWTVYSQRKSLVRVLQYIESIGILRVYEGDSNAYSNQQDSEVLYYNTGLSRYYCTNFTMDISHVESWRDFEKEQVEEVDEDHGNARTNRVYRQLIACPNMYWKEDSSPDAYYIKNKKNNIAYVINQNIGGTLIVNKHNASVIFEDKIPSGNYYPKANMLNEIVLLICHRIKEMYKDARKLVVQDDDTIIVTQTKFQDIVLSVKRQYQSLFSKEYREIADEKYVFLIKQFMKNWMMIQETENEITIYPICAIITGKYSKNVEEKMNG
mgnify:CR=1 FL=1